MYLNKIIRNDHYHVMIVFRGGFAGSHKIKGELKWSSKIIQCFTVNIVSCLMAVSGSFGKWLTQISTGFLKACYYDYGLHKCADREQWLLGRVQNDKMGLLKDSPLLRSAEQSEMLMLECLIKTVWLRIRYQFPQSRHFKLETKSSCGKKGCQLQYWSSLNYRRNEDSSVQT